MKLEITPAQALRRQLWHKITYATLNGDLPHQIDLIAAEAADYWFRLLEQPKDARLIAEALVRSTLGLNPRTGGGNLIQAARRAPFLSAPEKPLISAIPAACRSCSDLECAAELACITDALERNEHGRHINNDRCLGCGFCIGACRAAALSDKTEIVQVAQLLMDQTQEVAAVVAPAFAGQFGHGVFGEQVRAALTAFGFDRVVEVALGADVITIKEAEEYIRRRQRGDLFMITSCCCPPFIRLVQKFRPLLAHLISDSVSPMIAIGRLLKAENPKLKVVFIGPCIAKKSEARQPELAGAVDFVLTFEETAAMLQAGGIEVDGATQTADLADASHDGRIYGRSGGISTAIVRSINTLAPSLEVRIQRGNGIKECSQLLKLAEQGLLDATFIEGMACVGGCVGGPGKLIPPETGKTQVDTFADRAPIGEAVRNRRAHRLYTRYGQAVKLHSVKTPDPLRGT